MKRRAVAIALFFFFSFFNASPTLSQSAEISSDATRTLDLKDCEILHIFARLWKHTPLVQQERATWIVLNSNDEYESIDWLHTPQRKIAQWFEPLPERIAAQAHTHGYKVDPKPSQQDLDFARRLKIPVYTLSRKGVFRVTPDGVITQDLGGDWFKNTIEKCGDFSK